MVDIEELERLARAATPGPWYPEKGEIVTGEHEVTVTVRGTTITDMGTTVIAGLVNPDENLGITEADAAHIAAANPQTILALCAELKAARAVCEAAQALVAYYDDDNKEPDYGPEENMRAALSAWRRGGGGK